MERYSASRPTSGSTGKERPLDNGIPSPSCSPGIQRYLVIPRRVKEAFFAWALGQAQPVSARCGTVKSDPRRYNPVTLEFEMNATIEGRLSDHALRRCVCRKAISSRSFFSSWRLRTFSSIDYLSPDYTSGRTNWLLRSGGR